MSVEAAAPAEKRNQRACLDRRSVIVCELISAWHKSGARNLTASAALPLIEEALETRAFVALGGAIILVIIAILRA